MHSRVIKFLYKKEMLDVLRDKKTVLMMLVVPLVLYPLMFIFGMQLMARVSNDMATHTYNIALENMDETLFARLSDAAKREGNSLALTDSKDLDADLLNGKIDAYISVEEIDGKMSYEIHYLLSVTNSCYARDLLLDLLQSYSATLTVERIEAAGLDKDYILRPIDISSVDQATKEASAGSLLGKVLPFMLVVSLLLGTMYPAIDTTAGERERGTLETVLTLPVTNHELIFSKFLTVATIGVASALLNIVAMCCVGAYMYSMTEVVREDAAGIHLEKFIPAIIVGMLCVFAFAIFISAISMCFSAFAKSYKEANNYMTPLMLIVMFASFVGFFPNVTLTHNVALVPVVNICLLIRDLLAFKIDMGIIIIVLASNLIYGVVTILFLGRIYSSEAILFGDNASGVQIFERRANMIKGGVPTVSDMWLVVAVSAVSVLYIGGSVTLSNTMLGLLVTQLLLAGFPIFAAWYSKRSFARTFRLRACRLEMLLGGLLLVAGTILLGVLLTAFTSKLFPTSGLEAEGTIETIGINSFVLCFLLVAVLPAICEELMFRGFVLTALSARMRLTGAILISASIFGIYHMSLVKFFTTTLLGVVICYVAGRSGSILPGMLMHVFNNGLAVLTEFYPVQTSRVLPFISKDTLSVSDVALMLLVGILLALLGVFVIEKSAKRNLREQ